MLAAGRRVALLTGALVAWELLARSGRVSPLIVPSLVRIGREFGGLALHAHALGEAGVTLARALTGFGLAVVVGVALGVLMGRIPPAGRLLEPLFAASYPIPKIALFPVFIFVFGIGSLSKIVLVFLECLYPIVINTVTGARAVDRVLVWSARSMGGSPARVLWRVVVPAAAPYAFAGFRVALPIAMIVVVITEMISSANGLGYLVIYALASLRTDRMLAVVLAIALLGLGLDRLLIALRDRLVRWERLDAYF
jgi:ABC-type nitrate/sulfonate/bicarbonate transport system permease component